MESTPLPNEEKQAGGQSGIALFMVVAAMAILSLLAVDMTYVAGVNQRMAYDGMDQVRAHYLAKTGFKISLLRLKAYQQVQKLIGDATGGKGGGVPGVPKLLLERIWSFPFFFPIPSNIPGLTPSERERITKFEQESNLNGRFSAVIESESSRYNLNNVINGMVETSNDPTPKPSGSPTPGNSPNPSPSFDPVAAQTSLKDFLGAILDNKNQADPDFAAEYRDFRLEDFMDNLLAWADRTYERKGGGNREDIPLKRAPFYSLSELHLIPPLDDRLYDLFAPNLTVSPSSAINVNSVKRDTLKAIFFSKVADEELDEFFKFRDAEDEDHYFKKEDDFFKYVQDHFAALRGNADDVKKLRDEFAQRRIRFTTDEQTFKITVQAQSNQAVRLLEAWVTLFDPKTAGSGDTKNPGPGGLPNPAPNDTGNGSGTRSNEPPKSGLRVTFMRII